MSNARADYIMNILRILFTHPTPKHYGQLRQSYVHTSASMCGRQSLAKVTVLFDANNIPRIFSTPFLISTAFNRRENHLLHSSFNELLFHCLCTETTQTVSKKSTPFRAKWKKHLHKVSFLQHSNLNYVPHEQILAQYGLHQLQ